MRTFLLVVSFLSVLVLADSSSPRRPVPASQTAVPVVIQQSALATGTRMWRFAEIRVIPSDQAVADRTELESLRQRVHRAEAENLGLYLMDPAVRERQEAQVRLIDDLFHYAERQGSDQGKTPVAIEVQKHLNHIEGRMACESCHPSLVAGKLGVGSMK
jgi:hypothetical protein